ncbi:alpha/beta hydrolase [Mycobacterium sp. CBMA293]|uniref:alpha/beta hydrolase n=1 Tax=unclassified Mycolicibacterium TaxID=2636767 RepID=UPI0013264B2B|nr:MULTISPECIES: alpha/beta hydrolase [unclassified Mycolicibacterium]MUL45025.1 alpha/beta hydrolase [Mycolicibacterium sp. CBMA 360]MUL95620.1 alpha/beta hydrolase [Mycolicibacterium sp. CBMA 230]MUM32795.1 alpha/beta hydrolase [Mycolicibacterium sp. CBMA 361]MUL57864.1 alpha/beta hydrolase [Mycolicibacterium sp. CBMA 335]MUL72687.1 alpha/beta hydrolase [Mycolicibacterium sp. CBMA 311]
MSLDPQIAGLLEALNGGFPDLPAMTGAEARAAIRARYVPPAEPEPVASVTNTEVDGIPVRIYQPAIDGPRGPLPIFVFAHGGGFVFCDLDSHDGLCRSFANSIPAVVISVDYRLAPEHQWPAAAEDVYTVTQWAAAHAAEFGGDPTKLVVGGDSAGGNLSAVTALMTRDRGGAPLAAQVLLYPVLTADFTYGSYHEFRTGYYNTTAAMQWYWDQYVPNTADRENPYAAPLSASVAGTAPAIIVVTGYDPMRDEALAYTTALRDAGVPVTELYYGAIHGFLTMPVLDIAHCARREVCDALAKTLAA